MTIESISKYNLENVNQCELNENIGFNMEKAMRFIEFQSPDLIYFEGITSKIALDYFGSLVFKNKVLITEFLADNMADLNKKLSYDDFGEKVRVYGAAFQGHSCRNSLLRQNNTLPILDKNFINILVMHGNVLSEGEKNDCNPIFVKDLDTCGFDFCAFGHVHKFSDIVVTDNTVYAYPGVCEGRSFSETGSCGILSGTVTKDSVDLGFVKTSVREYCVVNIDITGLDSYDTVLDRIHSCCTNSEYIYKITLVGKKKYDLKLSIARLNEELSTEYFYAKVYAAYSEDINIELLKYENSLKGCFVRCMLKKAETSQDPELIYQAMAYGLQSFDGEVLFDDNP